MHKSQPLRRRRREGSHASRGSSYARDHRAVFRLYANVLRFHLPVLNKIGDLLDHRCLRRSRISCHDLDPGGFCSVTCKVICRVDDHLCHLFFLPFHGYRLSGTFVRAYPTALTVIIIDLRRVVLYPSYGRVWTVYPAESATRTLAI